MYNRLTNSPGSPSTPKPEEWMGNRPPCRLPLTGQNLGGPKQTKVPSCTSNHAFTNYQKLFFYLCYLEKFSLCLYRFFPYSLSLIGFKNIVKTQQCAIRTIN